MRKATKFCLSVVLLACTSAVSVAQSPLPRLKTDGGRVVDVDGRPVALRGVNLGNWLLFEPGALGGTANGAFGKFPDQANMWHVLRDRFGEKERRRLIDVYRDSYITARDFDNVKKFGFNVVRVGFDHELIESADEPYVLRPDAFKYLDYAVKEAKARGLYVLFDLHGAQGRQVSGKQSGDSSRADFWTVPDNRERALWLWEHVVRHFKGDTTVLGYENLNEPFSGKDEEVLEFGKRWYDRVRPLDPDTILVFPGMYSGVKFYGHPEKDHGWRNVMFDLHFYPGVAFSGPAATRPSTTQTASVALQNRWPKLAAELKAVNTPLFVGELSIVHKTGGGGEMLRRYMDFAADHGWASCIWTLKELSAHGGVTAHMWMLTTNANPIPPIDLHTSSKGEIEAAFHALATAPIAIDEDVLHWMTTEQKPSKLPPQPTTAPTAATRYADPASQPAF